MTISFGKDDEWLVRALEARREKYGSPYSVTIRRALVEYLAREHNTTPEELRSFSEGHLPRSPRNRSARAVPA